MILKWDYPSHCPFICAGLVLLVTIKTLKEKQIHEDSNLFVEPLFLTQRYYSKKRFLYAAWNVCNIYTYEVK